MNPSRRGDETEATLLGLLMEVGCSVSVPFGDSDRYDLIVDDGTELHRVQCKTGSWVNGTVRFNLYSSTVGTDGRVDADYTPEEVDAYAVHAPEQDESYWVPIAETGCGEMRLRVDEPHPKAPTSKINWANDYELVDRFTLP
ncbi:group I intron-associated PD-(D/E)XK endonuclease [Haloarchaeobius sp. HRN-SO-5]|uniref:group I intron-associated PD-(D/E)XK endonuclease n=1 Tax=Haloarchaeobius sp. HRN-SO-5 TaxID=3446118 RepID=UPI003EBB0505